MTDLRRFAILMNINEGQRRLLNISGKTRN